MYSAKQPYMRTGHVSEDSRVLEAPVIQGDSAAASEALSSDAVSVASIRVDARDSAIGKDSECSPLASEKEKDCELTDADDSSDEEFVAEIFLDHESKASAEYSRFGEEYLSKLEERRQSYAAYSFLLHQTGLAVLYSPAVNAEYYSKKRSTFAHSKLAIRHEELTKVIRDDFIALLFSFINETSSRDSCLKEFNAILLVEKNIRYIVRQALNPRGKIDPHRFLLSSESPLRKLSGCKQKITAQNLVRIEEQLKAVSFGLLSEILDFLENSGITKGGKFVNKKERELAIQRIEKKDCKFAWLLDELPRMGIIGGNNAKNYFVVTSKSKRADDIKPTFLEGSFIQELSELASSSQSPVKVAPSLARKKEEQEYEIDADDIAKLPKESPVRKLLGNNNFWQQLRDQLAGKLREYRWETRGEFGDKGVYVTTSMTSFIAMLRVFSRDFKRQQRTLADERFAESYMQHTIIRQWQSICAPFLASELEEITTTGARSDFVNDISSYADLCTKLQEILDGINRELSSAGREHITPADIAQSIRCLLQGEKEPLKRANTLEKIQLPVKQEARLLRFIIRMTYLMFATESMRNPANLITQQMLLDLIINDKTDWKNALVDYSQSNYPLMPMTAKLYDGKVSKTAQAARRVQSLYNPYLPIYYEYSGDLLDDASPLVAKLQELEWRVFDRWRELYLKEKDPDIHKQLTEDYGILYKTVISQFKRWYGFEFSHTASSVLKAEGTASRSTRQLLSAFNATTAEFIETREGKDISRIYWYEDSEMCRILEYIVKQKNGKTIEGLPIHILGPLDNMAPYGLVEALRAHNRQYGVVLVSFNLGRLHWVGLVLEYNKEGNLVGTCYYDAQGNKVPDFLNGMLQSMRREGDKITSFTCIQSDGSIRQTNGSDCGPCTIENLLADVGYREPAATDPVGRRLRHLQWLEQAEDDKFYASFYERQRLNRSSFSSSFTFADKLTTDFHSDKFTLIALMRSCPT